MLEILSAHRAAHLSPPRVLCQELLLCGERGLAITLLLRREVKLSGIGVHLLFSMAGHILLGGSVEALGSARLPQLLSHHQLLQWAKGKQELHSSCLRLYCGGNAEWPSLMTHCCTPAGSQPGAAAAPAFLLSHALSWLISGSGLSWTVSFSLAAHNHFYEGHSFLTVRIGMNQRKLFCT